MQKMEVKEIVSLIKQSSKLGVTELKIGDLHIKFSKKEDVDAKTDGFVPRTIPNKLEAEVTKEAEKELKVYRELLDNETLDCEDPAYYEDMIFNKEKVQEQDTPDE